MPKVELIIYNIMKNTTFTIFSNPAYYLKNIKWLVKAFFSMKFKQKIQWAKRGFEIGTCEWE